MAATKGTAKATSSKKHTAMEKSFSGACPHVLGLADFPPFKLYDKLVTIKVGEKKKEFTVHKGLVCHYSGYFRNAFTGGFREAHNSAVELLEDDEDVFECFLRWLYTRKIFEDEHTYNFNEGCELLVALYIFGDARDIPTLRNATVDKMIEVSTSKWANPFVSEIELLYENTTKGSKMRLLFVHLFTRARKSFADLEKADLETPLPHDFLVEALVSMEKERREGIWDWHASDWSEVDRCDYHDSLELCMTRGSTKRQREDE